MEDKTNVMRFLDQKKIKYEAHHYAAEHAVSGIEVAEMLNIDPQKVFKTLVTVAKSNKNYVFVIPVAEELDLKKAAKCVGEKSIEMIKSKDLLPLTGYVHGGCSPLQMKKEFKTVIDINAAALDTFIFSAGRIGYQVEISPQELKKVLRFEMFDVKV